MRVLWISIRRLKIHEFFQTLNYIRGTGKTWHDIYLRLGELQSEATARFLRQASALLIMYFLLNALGDENLVSITIKDVTASIPIVYVSATSSLILFVTAQSLQSLLTLISIRTKEATKMKLPRFSSNAYGLFHGQDEMALAVPVILNNFFRERLPTSKILSAMTLFVYFFFFLPLLAMWYFLIQIQITFIFSESSGIFNKVVALSGVLICVSTALYIALFNLPLPMKKRRFGIRWGFLSFLYPTGGHPRIHEWLEDDLKSTD